ncbi:MAG TPA: GH3 auxin-responsive promoter family protein [Arachidicoccus sp.]|nr:GH3 auxin-responsive promoter family protein [Arachidicoccus sp.]
MKIFSPTISRLARLRHWRIEEWLLHPIDTQREVLQDLVTHGQNTSLGRKYGFSNLFDTRQFKEAVPIHEYEDIKPYIDRIMKGEENVLWNTPVSWFAKSSGTTSDKSKFIPITTESLEDCHYQAAKDVLTLHYHNRPDSDLLTGKGLVIGGSHQVSQLNEEIFCGDLSAVLLQNTPFWGQWLRTPELSIALMDEWEAKLEALAQSTIKEDVTSISGVPTWTLILIKRILEITGKKQLKEVWPNLELYMHGGVSFTPYREQFAKLLGPGVQYLEMYNASEGFFAVQDRPSEEGMLLLLNHGIFYEFMPLEDYGKANPQTIGLKDVQLGKNYAPVISTNGGLWRYLLGDTIQFTSLHPFRIKVSGRVRHFINAFGEELIIDNADLALASTCEQLNCQVNEYTAAPIYFSDESNGAHEWLFEFETAPTDLSEFTIVLDEALKQQNSDYEAKRHKNIALGPPVVRVLPAKTFNNWLKSKNKLGGQHKVPRLSNDRTYIEEILSTLEKPVEI